MSYCIAEFQKVKSMGQIAAMASHNLRIKLSQKDKARIDKARTPLNQVLENPLGIDLKSVKGMGASFEKYWRESDIEIKKDNVLLIDLVLTSSPEFWGEWHKNNQLTAEGKKKLDDWVKVQMDFIKKHFGPQAVKFAVLHLDETTPHIHLMLSPEETKVMKFRNQYGTKEITKTTLNARRWGPSFWEKFVTAHAKANEKLGLKRGKEKSMARKITLKEYQTLIDMASEYDYKKTLTKLVDEVLKEELGVVNTKASVLQVVKEKLVPRLNVLAKSNKALKELLAMDREHEMQLMKKLQAQATKDITDALATKQYHGNKLKAIQELEAKNKEQAEIIEALRLENERLKPKKNLTRNNPNYQLKA